MRITDPFVLPPDTLLVPIADLETESRARINSDDGDVAITRTQSRVIAKIVDASTAILLRQFETPCTVAQGILQSSRLLHVDPEALLVEAYPVLRGLIDGGYLVHENDPAVALGGEPSLAHGDRVGSAEVVRCIHALDDVEVYLVRMPDGRTAALKIAQRDSPAGSASVETEAATLAAIAERVAPALWDAGTFEGRRYVIMEWRRGIDAWTAADEMRSHSVHASRARLARLCCSIADAYATLHAAGVIHADVHAENLLVDIDDRLTIIDFAYAQRVQHRDGDPTPARGGIGYFVDPECAAARLDRRPPPPCGELAEQYSVAALLYTLLTGATYLDFRLADDDAMRQIVHEQMRPFALVGAMAWPDMERVLARALAKDPRARFPSMVAFTSALQRVAQSVDTPSIPRNIDAVGAAAYPQLEDIVRQLALGGTLARDDLVTPPTCSVAFGAAGVAFALYRMALVADDAKLLAAANLWTTRTVRHARSKRAFYNEDLGLTPDSIERVSLYHGAPGAHVVCALVAQALGDSDNMERAVLAFIRASRGACMNLDLTLGQAGALLGSAVLMDAMPLQSVTARRALRRHGDAIAAELQAFMTPFAPVGHERNARNLGVAHGWVGILYALSCWASATRQVADPEVRRRFLEVAQCGEAAGRGMRWPWRVNGIERSDDPLSHDRTSQAEGHMPGWCNGSAGLTIAFLAADASFPDDGFRDAATAAAWNAWEEDVEGVPDLCCGYAGRAYAMLALSRASGDHAWRGRAADLVHLGVEALNDWDMPATSLYKGALGLAVLRRELTRPELARMPLFELEGWTQ